MKSKDFQRKEYKGLQDHFMLLCNSKVLEMGICSFTGKEFLEGHNVTNQTMKTHKMS